MKRKMTDKMMRKLNLSRKAMGNMKKHGGSMMGGVPMKRRDDMMMMQMMQRGGMSPSLEEQVRRRMLNQMARADRSMLEQKMLAMRMGGQPSRAQMMKALQAKRMYGGSIPPMRKSVGLPGGPNEFPLPRKRRM